MYYIYLTIKILLLTTALFTVLIIIKSRYEFQWYRIIMGGRWGYFEEGWLPLNDESETDLRYCSRQYHAIESELFEDWS
jgi:hypothetical protein